MTGNNLPGGSSLKAVAIKLGMIFSLTAVFALFAAQPIIAQKKQSADKKPVPLSAQAQKEFDDLAKRASEALSAGRLEEALNFSGEALKRNPNWPEGWWYVGTIFYDHDRYEEARDAFRNLTNLQPKNARAYALLGLCEYQTREYERALVNLQSARILGLGDNQQLNTVARYHAAILMTRFEQFEVGFEILREFAREQNEGPKVIEAFGINALRMPFLPPEVPPDKREIILLAGRAAFDWAARRTHEAQKGFEDLVARYPQSPNVHYIFGSYLLNQDADAALEEFRKELEISPSHVAAMLQIAFEYIKRGDFNPALPLAEKAVELSPNLFPARNALGRILLETGDIERAVKELEAGVKLAPDSPEMHFILARAYARAGRKEDAARERKIFMDLDKLMRTQREGAQSVGGVDAKSEDKKPQ